MKSKELRNMGAEELSKKVQELRKDLIKENAQIATGTTPKSPAKIKNMKKTIARILTIIKEKESQEQKTESKEVKK